MNVRYYDYRPITDTAEAGFVSAGGGPCFPECCCVP